MRFRRQLERNATVNLIPMIDVVFQLVVFFMVSSTFKITPAIGLSLPASATAEPVTMSNLVVAVHSEQRIYVNELELQLDEVSAALSSLEGVQPDAIKSVIVEGDRAVSYELLVELLDVLRSAGFHSVALRTRAVKDEP